MRVAPVGGEGREWTGGGGLLCRWPLRPGSGQGKFQFMNCGLFCVHCDSYSLLLPGLTCTGSVEVSGSLKTALGRERRLISLLCSTLLFTDSSSGDPVPRVNSCDLCLFVDLPFYRADPPLT